MKECPRSIAFCTLPDTEECVLLPICERLSDIVKRSRELTEELIEKENPE